MKAALRWARREPLVAFFAAALGLFALHGARAPSEGGAIVIRRAEVIAAQTARLGRAPTEAELAVSIDRRAETEALVREARRLGLADEDPIVRRRLAQKMELLAEDLATLEPPSEAELRAQLEAEPERYAAPARRSVRQVLLRDEAAARDAAARLAEGAEPGTLGRPFAGGLWFPARTEAQLASVLSAEVARAAFEAAPDTWVGPVKSVFGWHLLRVERVWASGAPELSNVRERVQADVERARRGRAKDDVRAKARARYSVEVVQ